MDQVSQPWTKEVSGGGAQDCYGYDLQQGKNAVAPREEILQEVPGDDRAHAGGWAGVGLLYTRRGDQLVVPHDA